MSHKIAIQPLDADAFAPFGEVLDLAGEADRIINQGNCGRFHDRARLDIDGGSIGISLFDARPRTLPYFLDMMERHPLASQAFLPLHRNPWLVIVAPDGGPAPGPPMAFLAAAGQGVNIARGVWHGVLTPLAEPGHFAVVDRIAPAGEDADANLQEHWSKVGWTITD